MVHIYLFVFANCHAIGYRQVSYILLIDIRSDLRQEEVMMIYVEPYDYYWHKIKTQRSMR
jgi:hypothetical protein